MENEEVGVAQTTFSSNKQHEVISRDMIKNFRVTSDKRRILNVPYGNYTLPYGWVDSANDYINVYNIHFYDLFAIYNEVPKPILGYY